MCKPHFLDRSAPWGPGVLSFIKLSNQIRQQVRREETTRPREPWKETLEEFGARLRGVCQDINDSCDVEGLCRALLMRVQALVEAQGDRIRP